MIKSFADDETEAIFHGKKARRLPPALFGIARDKLARVHLAGRIDDLRTPPGNHLEKLRADRAGQWSIRINRQFRICFRFEDEDAYDVEIVDYH